MISTFNGRRRSLGAGEVKDFQLAISTKMRNYLYLFKGSSWNVFTCIALHIDERGWSWPTVDTIRQNTRIAHDTIYRSLNHLCEMKIRGCRVMLRTQKVPPHIPAEKLRNNRPRNYYLIFPSREEIELYEGDGGDAAIMTSEKSDTKNRRSMTSEKSDTKNRIQRNTNFRSEDKPSPPGQEKPDTHTHNQHQAQPGLFQTEANGNGQREGVCVSRSKFSLEQRKAYAADPENLDAEGKPLGKAWLLASADGRADELLEDWFLTRARRAAVKRCDHTCPLCHGTTMEVVEGKGARRCPNMTPPEPGAPADSDDANAR